MGYAARVNHRSRSFTNPLAPGQPVPAAYTSLHRFWRAVGQFKNDRAGFDGWLAGTVLSDAQRAGLELLWDKQNPEPLVRL